MKRFFKMTPCLLILMSLLLCACTDAEFLTEETFLNRFNALDETQQLNARDALAKEEDTFIGHSYFLSPKGDETYMLCLQIDKESAELKACSLLYARMGDEESDTFFSALASRTAQAFTGQSAQACDGALKKAGVLGAARDEANAAGESLEWNGFRISKEKISLGYRMTIETIKKDQSRAADTAAQEEAGDADPEKAETPASEAPAETGASSSTA